MSTTPIPFDERLRAAILPIVAVCEPNQYDGPATEYCTYTYTEMPEGRRDDSAEGVRLLVSLHWFLPTRQRPSKRRRIAAAIEEIEGTPPTVENASDRDGQHYVFEFEHLEEGF